jgi:hypothetical protein
MLTKKSKADFGFLPLRPGRLISLWNMIKFWAASFASELNWLKDWDDHAWIEMEESRDSKASAAQKVELVNGLNPIEKHCEILELNVSRNLCVRLKNRLKGRDDCYWQVIQAELEGITRSIQKELETANFTYVPFSKAKFLPNDSLFGESVERQFPDVKEEIKDAGNCLAADLNTAAVFHLMRIAEAGLRRLAKPFKISLPHKIEFATWGKVLDAIQIELDKKGVQRSKAKDKKLQRYSQLLLEIKAFQHLWRNPVSHLRGRYDELQAQSAFNHVRAFMQKLSD